VSTSFLDFSHFFKAISGFKLQENNIAALDDIPKKVSIFKVKINFIIGSST
jgi:hypothetical protein